MRKTMLMLALAGASAASAAHLTPAEALARVAHGSRSAADAELVMEISSGQTSDPMVYLFSTRQGYLVVSADDRAPALLGYSDEALPAEDGKVEVAPAMQAWLEEYARQIAAAPATASRADDIDVEVREPIPPMLTTKWGQDAPYNDSCPELIGRRCVTGCVATAMAQVIYFHRYPVTTGYGSIEYTTQSFGLPVSFDFSETTFDWDAMTSAPAPGSESGKAVATLMAACGASVEMNYGINGSSATSNYVPGALKKYFGYGNNARMIDRQGYSVKDWENLVYSQLADSLPLIYSGANAKAGHSFVCDGYSSDGFFHFNWGWNGASDGYYRLYALDPMNQGTGGSDAGYSWSQSIIVDVCPPKDDVEPVYSFSMAGQLSVDNPTPRPGDYIIFSGGVFCYNSTRVNDVAILIGYTSSNGELQTAETNCRADFLETAYGWSDIGSFAPENLAPGEYTVRIMVSVDGGKPFSIETNQLGEPNYLILTVGEDGSLTYAQPERPAMMIDGIRLTSPLNLHSYFRVEGTAVHSGTEPYFGTVAAAFVNDFGELCFTGNTFSLQLDPGQTKEIEYISGVVYTWGGHEVAPGAYRLVFVDYDALFYGGRIVLMSDVIDVEATLADEPSAASITSYDVENGATGVDPSAVVVNYGVTGTEGFFIGTKKFGLGYLENEIQLAYYTYDTPIIFVEKDSTVVGSFIINASSYLTGRERGFVLPLDGGFDQDKIKWFHISETGALETVTAPADKVMTAVDPSGLVNVISPSPISAIEVWSVSGRCVARVKADGTTAEVNLGAMPRGIYIIKAQTADGPAAVRILKP